jgi:predicted dehydrogenase
MRIGCLGAARITPPAIVHPSKVRPGAVLQAVAARSPARAEAYAREHGFSRVAPDYEALVTAPDIDLVYNALPVNLHARWSIRALEAGKHVLCEKPFAMNVTEARAVLAAAKASGRRVVEAFHYRHHPGFRKLLAWIDSGAIGAVTAIDARFNIGIDDRNGEEIRHRPDTGGGAFMDLGCYPLSWTLNILRASPVSVEAKSVLTGRGVDASTSARLSFAGGATATLSASMAIGEPFAAHLHVRGTNGEIHFVNPLAPHFGASLKLKSGDRVEEPRLSRLSTYAWQLDMVLDALQTGETLPTEGDAIIRQQEALDAIYVAAGLAHLRKVR